MFSQARRIMSAVIVTVSCISAGCAAAAPSVEVSSTSYTRRLTDAQLARLRQCEASGRYDAVSASGRYRGAYQFDRATWRSVGGTGDPAAAPAWEQDHRARILYDRRGSAPWPVCGRRI